MALPGREKARFYGPERAAEGFGKSRIMSSIIKGSMLILYCSTMARFVIWLRNDSWPTLTPEILLPYPPPSSIKAVNDLFSFLWNLPIELWFIGPMAIILMLGAGNRNDHRSSPA